MTARKEVNKELETRLILLPHPDEKNLRSKEWQKVSTLKATVQKLDEALESLSYL